MKLLLISIIIHILSNIAFGMHFLSSKSLNGHGSWKCFHQKTFGYTYRHSFQFLEMRVICCASSERLNSRSNFYLRLAQIPCKIERDVMLAYAMINLRIYLFFVELPYFVHLDLPFFSFIEFCLHWKHLLLGSILAIHQAQPTALRIPNSLTL